MKRCMAILCVLSVIFLLCGCKKNPQSSQTSDPLESTGQGASQTGTSDDDIPMVQKPMYAISLPPVKEAAEAQDGTVIFNCIYQNISLVLPEPEVADQIILDFLNRTDSMTRHAEAALAAAKQAYPSESQWQPHLLQMLYTPIRFDSGILSLYGSKVSYTGGAHTGYSGASVNYDLLSGKVLRLTDIMRSQVTADTLSQLVIDALSAVSKEKQLFTTYDQTVKQLFGAELSGYENWYFSQEGLCFYFDPYEIAPFSSGSIVAQIPYSQLTGILEDAYFPAEEDPFSGTLEAEIFTEAALNAFTQFSEIVLDENSTKILLHTDKALSDIRITTGDSSDETAPSSGTTVFAAYTLTPGDAIMVEAEFAKNPLSISCRIGDETHCFTVTVSGDTVLLTEK